VHFSLNLDLDLATCFFGQQSAIIAIAAVVVNLREGGDADESGCGFVLETL